MFSYKFPIAIVTTVALLQPPVVIAQDFEEVNNIARNISVKITGYGNGSGFILEREGNIYSVVTNKHVVPIDTEYQVQTYDGTKHQVTNRQEIPDLDLAIIQFESRSEYQVAELGNSKELQPRQFISVAGFPGEQTDIDIIDGQIRSIRQEIIANPKSKQGYALIYTNQTLPGSSGGAVLDENGRVIAINGEGETDIQTGREISRGIPINLFLVAKTSLLMIDKSSSANILNNSLGNRTLSNESTEVNTSGNYRLAYTISKAGGNDSVASIETVSGQTILSTKSNQRVDSVAIIEDKIVSRISGQGFAVNIWDLTTGELDIKIPHYEGSNRLMITNKYYVVGYYDFTIDIRNLLTRELIKTFDNYSDWLAEVVITDEQIIIGGMDRKITIWNLATGELKQTISNQNVHINSMAANKKQVFSASDDNTIKVWNIVTGELEKTLSDHTDSVNSIAVNNDYIFSASDDNTIKVWNIVTGELEKTLSDHNDSVNSVAVSGDYIVSNSNDNIIKVWKLQQ